MEELDTDSKLNMLCAALETTFKKPEELLKRLRDLYGPKYFYEFEGLGEIQHLLDLLVADDRAVANIFGSYRLLTPFYKGYIGKTYTKGTVECPQPVKR